MLARRIMTVLGLSAATLLGATSVASASGNISIPAGSVHYYSSTNTFYVKDLACDNMRVYAHWRTSSSGNNPIVNESGCNTTVNKVVNLANGTRLWYRICVDDAFGDTCSPWREDPHGA
jgi:hypothetical protein